MNIIEQLAAQQLVAYNDSDLEGFVACYHEDVIVYDGDEKVCQGKDNFRERYRELFERLEFGGTVPERLSNGGHCVDLEHYWRVDPETQERTEGTILVCYTLREHTIGTVRFLRP
jgi:hypothetical protein